MLLVAPGWLASGCATRVPLPPGGDETGARSAVEHFLEAANRRDLQALARMFGTLQGPVADTGALQCGLRRLASWLAMAEPCPDLRAVELRMHTIATLLSHDGYEVVDGARVPGREPFVTRIAVDMRRGSRVYRDVGFVVVPQSSGWLVEAVELEKITGR